MRIYVKAKPNAGAKEIVHEGQNHYCAKLKVPPEKGKANKLLVKLLAKHFKTAQSNILIVGGKTSRTKIVDINP